MTNALRIQASDLAGTAAEQIIPFIVDNTPPVVNMISPVVESFIGAANSPISIECELDEDNPAAYQVSYGLQGSDPTTFIVLFESSDFPLANSTVNWDVTALADGPYTGSVSVRRFS